MTLKRVFSPLKLRHKTLKNRIDFGAHTTNVARDGWPGDQHFGYYLERAIGGAAMITVEPMPVNSATGLSGATRAQPAVMLSAIPPSAPSKW